MALEMETDGGRSGAVGCDLAPEFLQERPVRHEAVKAEVLAALGDISAAWDGWWASHEQASPTLSCQA